MTSLNFARRPRETVERILDLEKLSRRGSGPRLGHRSPTLCARSPRLARAALEVQGFLVAVLPEEKLQRNGRPAPPGRRGNTTSDRWSVDFAEPAAYLQLHRRSVGPQAAL